MIAGRVPVLASCSAVELVWFGVEPGEVLITGATLGDAVGIGEIVTLAGELAFAVALGFGFAVAVAVAVAVSVGVGVGVAPLQPLLLAGVKVAADTAFAGTTCELEIGARPTPVWKVGLTGKLARNKPTGTWLVVKGSGGEPWKPNPPPGTWAATSAITGVAPD